MCVQYLAYFYAGHHYMALMPQKMAYHYMFELSCLNCGYSSADLQGLQERLPTMTFPHLHFLRANRETQPHSFSKKQPSINWRFPWHTSCYGLTGTLWLLTQGVNLQQAFKGEPQSLYSQHINVERKRTEVSYGFQLLNRIDAREMVFPHNKTNTKWKHSKSLPNRCYHCTTDERKNQQVPSQQQFRGW